jgi:DNA-binding transcriptional LysR family regulator
MKDQRRAAKASRSLSGEAGGQGILMIVDWFGVACQWCYRIVHNFSVMDDLFTQSGLSLDRLRTFCLIAEHGGFTKATRGDAAKQPLYSRQLKELEAFFGTELVRRSGKSFALNEEGKRLYELARSYFGALSDFKNTCSNRPIRIQVGAGDSIIQWHILPRLAALRKALPNIVLKLLNLPTEQIVERVASGDLDLGVVRQTAVGSELKSHMLGKLEFALFVPKRLAKSNWEATLKSCPMAALEGTGEFRQELEKAALKEQFEPRIEVECASFPAVATAMKSAGLAGILPVAAADELGTSSFVRLDPAWLHKLARSTSLIASRRALSVRPELETIVEEVAKILES